MIGKLKGLVDCVGAEEAVIDVHGVGYLVACGARTLQRIPAPGQEVSIFVETHVREDHIKLFGFLSEEERAWFVRLQVIQGVGAKVALAILDVMSPPDIMNAAALEDASSFARANGVGPRLASRIVTELKDKPAPPTRFGGASARPSVAAVAVAAAGGGGAPAGDGEARLRADAVSALVNLGLNEFDVRAAVASARSGFDDAPGVDALVKAALKEMGR
ncbi:MAG: Holliday junction branch migration protein RuvA [Maricaulaceae bacterium]|jgi:Holliday junction DNA helicase RuvA